MRAESFTARFSTWVTSEGIPITMRGRTSNAIAMVVDAANKIEQRTLKVDRAIGGKWLVAEGLGAGDRVVVEGLQKIRPGVAVKVVPASAPATTPAPAAGK